MERPRTLTQYIFNVLLLLILELFFLTLLQVGIIPGVVRDFNLSDGLFGAVLDQSWFFPTRLALQQQQVIHHVMSTVARRRRLQLEAALIVVSDGGVWLGRVLNLGLP